MFFFHACLFRFFCTKISFFIYSKFLTGIYVHLCIPNVFFTFPNDYAWKYHLSVGWNFFGLVTYFSKTVQQIDIARHLIYYMLTFRQKRSWSHFEVFLFFIFKQIFQVKFNSEKIATNIFHNNGTMITKVLKVITRLISIRQVTRETKTRFILM